MQRIDENTYIDDTLVTCAEYQLFIDELREQGKYYQPDHWASDQFPEGQAREPILGMRHSDAIAFCEWLTQREGEGWRYRLPTDVDAKEYPLHPKQETLAHGYWIISNNNQSRFTWIGTIPYDPRKINTDVEHPRALDLELARAFAYAFNIADDFAFARDDDLGRNLDPFDRTHVLEISIQDFNKFDITYDLYVDDLTLRERIAGRSPAFEGIRLVKYREQS